MSISFRKADIFAAGLLVGAAAVWLVVYLVTRNNGPDPARASVPPTVATAARPAAAPVVAAAKPVAAVAAARPQSWSQCPVQPATTPGPDADGRLKLQADLSAKNAADVASYIVVGKEAAAADRPRDAEVAFIMACRASDPLIASGSLAPADARYQLGRHYANAVLAGDSGASPKRAELLKRSELLYADSLQSYVAKHGREHEKSRFAAEGLAKVQQHIARSGPQPVTVAAAQSNVPVPRAAAPVAVPMPPPQARAPAPAPLPRLAPTPTPGPVARAAAPERPPMAVATRSGEPSRPAAVVQPPVSYRVARTQPRPTERQDVEIAVVSAPVRQATGDANRASPSFDCSRARSYSERTICADSELARLDRDLGRLHARAKSATTDSAAFRRRNDREWQRRESSCRDRDCLVRWYAERRNQLLNDDAVNYSER